MNFTAHCLFVRVDSCLDITLFLYGAGGGDKRGAAGEPRAVGGLAEKYSRKERRR